VVAIAATRLTERQLFGFALVPFLLGLFNGWWVLVAAGLGAAAFQGWRTLRPMQRDSIAAAVGSAASLGLLNLRDFGLELLSAQIAGAVASIVVWLGLRTLTLNQRREIIKRLAMVGAVVVVVGFLAGLSGLLGRSSAEAGVDRAEDGLAFAQSGKQVRAINQLEMGASHFADAESSFGAFWAKPARLVPVLAQNHRALQVAAAQGEALTSVAARAASSADINQVRGSGGRIDLDLLQAVGAELELTESTMTNARAALANTNSPWLLPPLASSVSTADQLLFDAQDDISLAAHAARVVPGMLGADQTRTYLVMFTNPAEAREFGGFAAAYGFIQATDGRVSVLDAGYGGDVDDALGRIIEKPGFDTPEIYPPAYLAYGNDGLINYFGNLTGTIDLQTIATAARDAMPKKGFPEIDGLMIIDPFALEAMMGLVDLQVPLPEADIVLDQDNLAEYIMIGQYEGFELGGDRGVFESFDGRTESLVQVGEQIFTGLLSSDIPGPTALGDAFGPMVRQKRLQFTTYDDDENAFLNRTLIRSEVPFLDKTEFDHLHVASDTAAPNKLEPYVERSIRYEVDLDPTTGRFFGEVFITFTNTAPEGLATYVQGAPGWYFDLEPGVARQRVSVWSNQNVNDAFVDSVRSTSQELYIEYGLFRRLIFVDIPRGESRTVRMDIAGATTPGSYRIFLGAQPRASLDDFTINVRVTDDWIETSSGESTFARNFELTEDVVLQLDFEQR